jgi:hypothetical protein
MFFTDLDLTGEHSLVAADPYDCGSIEDEQGNRIVEKETDISADDLEKTLRERLTDSYNEWVVRDYAVRGIFGIPPFDLSYLKVPDYPYEVPDLLRSTEPILDIRQSSFEEVAASFPRQTIYTFREVGIFRHASGEFHRVEQFSIYEIAPRPSKRT